MTYNQYMTWLIKVGCGWLGWLPSQVRECHLQDIHEAYEGKVDMLKACYGGPSEEKEKGPVRRRKVSSIDDFDKITGI